MTRTRAVLGAVACSILGGLALSVAGAIAWAIAGALVAHRPKGWAALAVLMLGSTTGAFYGWQVGQAYCHDSAPEPPAQTPGAPPVPPPQPAPRQGWVTRIATTKAKQWRRTGEGKP